MHYKNGREARDGDAIVTKFNERTLAGVLHSTVPGSNSCNGQIAIAIPGGFINCCVTVGECYHAEDALKAIEGAQVPLAIVPEVSQPIAPAAAAPAAPAAQDPPEPAAPAAKPAAWHPHADPACQTPPSE